MRTRWIRPLQILGVVLLVDAPISGTLVWRDQGRLAGIIVVGSHLVLAVYGIVVIPYFLRRAAAREQDST
jgi:hypothetical protein